LQNNPFSGKDPSGYCEETLGTHIKDCVTVTANYSDGSSRNLGPFNPNGPGDIARAAATPLPSNGADSLTSKDPSSAPTSGGTPNIGGSGKTVSSQPQSLPQVTVVPDSDWIPARYAGGAFVYAAEVRQYLEDLNDSQDAPLRRKVTGTHGSLRGCPS
jgi:hypothetical protein